MGPTGASVTTSLDALLTPARRVVARDEARRWIKRLRHVPFDAATMRERFTYRGDSLWWFTELYLHKMRHLERAAGAVIALDAAIADFAPASITVETSSRVVRDAARAVARARGVPVKVTGRRARERSARSFSVLTAWAARLSRLRSAVRRRGPRPEIAAFVHTAFWRPPAGAAGPAQEAYIGPVLAELTSRLGPGHVAHVGVGPRRNFRARRWWDPLLGRGADDRLLPIETLAPGRAIAGSIALWQRRHEMAAALTRGDGIRAAAEFRGCDLWPVLETELQHTALLQWPWAARAMDEAGAAVETLEPGLVLTYAEAGGWGRALVLEARRRGVPSVGIQHGFIYHHWLNYLHEPDEWAPAGSDRGVPAPDRTLVFDRYAAEHLHEAGGFPSDAVVVTGSARLDAMAPRIASVTEEARRAIRTTFGATADTGLAVLAAKFSEVQPSLPALVSAVASLPAVRLVIKPHPAETPDVYRPFVDGIANAAIAGPDADLAAMLAAADVLVTMNSTVAIDAMVLGLPALVIGAPSNLTPFVEAGVMAGAADAEIGPVLERVLYDRRVREGLRQRAAAFVDRYAMRPGGRAAARAADAILALLNSRRHPNDTREVPQIV
ncbi:MAG: hypothetical protein IT184_07955 [Acidobacteria bacterium]|nr:hypothetical protein [Acidobacteriota bacterium]